MRLLPYGDRAILVELPDFDTRRRLDEVLRAGPIDGVVEHVPAARTVLVRAGTAAELPRIAARLRGLRLDAVPAGAEARAEPVEIPVRYDGADLADLARHLGERPGDVVARHTRQTWTVEFSGFTPGFGYLVGDEGGPEVPRRDSPRTRIPAGAVGLAGPFTGVYPRSSPGGWQLIGTTDARMWDTTRQPPALLTPGTRVRFVEVPGG